MTPMIEAAEREELARQLELSRQGMKSIVIIQPDVADKIVSALRQSAAAPVVTDAMVERMAHRFAEVFFRNAEPDTLVDLVAVETAMRSAVALQAALSVQATAGVVSERPQSDREMMAQFCDDQAQMWGDDKNAEWYRAIAKELRALSLTQSGRGVAEGDTK